MMHKLAPHTSDCLSMQILCPPSDINLTKLVSTVGWRKKTFKCFKLQCAQLNHFEIEMGIRRKMQEIEELLGRASLKMCHTGC